MHQINKLSILRFHRHKQFMNCKPYLTFALNPTIIKLELSYHDLKTHDWTLGNTKNTLEHSVFPWTKHPFALSVMNLLNGNQLRFMKQSLNQISY